MLSYFFFIKFLIQFFYKESEGRITIIIYKLIFLDAAFKGLKNN